MRLNRSTLWRHVNEVISDRNRQIKGWAGYFHFGNSTWVMEQIWFNLVDNAARYAGPAIGRSRSLPRRRGYHYPNVCSHHAGGYIKAVRKFVCILGVAFVLAVSWGTWSLLKEGVNDPSHGGHRLSHWLQDCVPAPEMGSYLPFRLSTESALAVREIGTNALPALLQWMTKPEDGLKGKIVTWVESDRIPPLARRMLISIYPKSYRPSLTILAFRVLGDDAKDAVPSLVQMLQTPDNARWAAMALCAIGSEGATAALDQAFRTIQDGVLRSNIILQLEHGISPALESSYVPLLARRLKGDSSSAARMSATQVLGKLHSATLVVPMLVEALSNSDAGVRFVAAEGLGHFGPSAVSAVPSLETALNDENPQVRIDAAQALRAIRGAGAVQ